MTVETTLRKNTYTGDGVTTEFDFSFKIGSVSEVIVMLTTISSGAENILSTDDYNLTANTDLVGGTVEYPKTGSPLSSLYKITIYREVSLEQELDIKKIQAFDSTNLEKSLDRLTMKDQEMQEEVDRCLKATIESTKSFDEYIDEVNNTVNDCATIKSETQVLLDAAGLPSSLVGSAGKILIVNSLENGYDFTTEPTAFELVPVGTVLPFLDFDAAVTFNTDYFKYCDGWT